MGVIKPQRLGLGPVFGYEWTAASRRWQGYAQRSLFIAVLLVALTVVWAGRRNPGTIRGSADLAQSFFIAVIGTQLTLVLLVAPGATAGAICLDRARGTLTHLLMTDLSGAEIVLGKLAARLVPVTTLVLCTFPVLTLLSLLGGIDPDGLLGALVVTLGLAVLGSSIALLFSLWARRTHEALLGTYAILGLWMLAPIMLGSVPWFFVSGLPLPEWRTIHPFYLAFAPYLAPGSVNWLDYQRFFGATLAISAVLAAIAVFRLRAVATRDRRKLRLPRLVAFERPANAVRAVFAPLAQRLGPSLDVNPVLWREWHRNRPSAWARAVVLLFVLIACTFTGIALFRRPVWFGAGVSALQVGVGLLLLSVTASTSLAEERSRGSLDVLMTTTLTTREIVLGKWLGTFKSVPLLAILPILNVLGSSGVQAPRWIATTLMGFYVVATGAAVTSLGLAAATWCARLSRALALTMSAYLLMAVGWMFLVMASTGPHPYGFPLIAGSPVFGPAVISSLLEHSGTYHIDLGCSILWVFAYFLVALGLLGATLATFDSRLGRASGRPHAWRPRRRPASLRNGQQPEPDRGPVYEAV